MQLLWAPDLREAWGPWSIAEPGKEAWVWRHVCAAQRVQHAEDVRLSRADCRDHLRDIQWAVTQEDALCGPNPAQKPKSFQQKWEHLHQRPQKEVVGICSQEAGGGLGFYVSRWGRLKWMMREGMTWSFLCIFKMEGKFLEDEEWKQTINDAFSLTKWQGRAN